VPPYGLHGLRRTLYLRCVTCNAILIATTTVVVVVQVVSERDEQLLVQVGSGVGRVAGLCRHADVSARVLQMRNNQERPLCTPTTTTTTTTSSSSSSSEMDDGHCNNYNDNDDNNYSSTSSSSETTRNGHCGPWGFDKKGHDERTCTGGGICRTIVNKDTGNLNIYASLFRHKIEVKKLN